MRCFLGLHPASPRLAIEVVIRGRRTVMNVCPRCGRDMSSRPTLFLIAGLLAGVASTLVLMEVL